MRREQTSRESRELILDAAATLFAEKGYRRTTFADVAEWSGISRGSIPWHFGSKQGLLLAVLQRSAELLRVRLAEPASGQSAGADDQLRVTAGIAAFFERPTTKLFVTLLVEALEPDSAIRDEYVAIHDMLRGQCRLWLEHHRLPDAVSTEALAVAIVGAGIGIHQQWLLAPDRVDHEQTLNALRAMVAAVLRP